MTLAEWLKIQGAEVGDIFHHRQWADGQFKLSDMRDDSYRYISFEAIGYSQTYGSQTIDPADLQLYRMVNGELQRINRPYITCTTCGQSAQIEKADGWCCYFENGNYCPDCEAKRKAQAVIQESLTTEKIKISPCPRCGSRNIRAWEVSYFSNAIHDYQLLVCQNCYYENDRDAWRNDGNQYTDITDKYEVEK